MDILIKNFEMIINIISAIFPIVIAVLTFLRYQSSVKIRNRKIILHNSSTLFWRSMIYYTLIFPIFLLIIQVTLIISKNKNLALPYSLVYILLIAVFMIIYYIKISKEAKINNIIQFLHIYVFPLLCLVLVPFILTFLTILVVEIDNKSLAQYLSAYILNIICVSGIYFSFVNARDVTRYVKEVRIFYSENDKMKVNLNIKYEDFNIDKHYIKFYLRQKGYRKVIQTKDLIRIEYYYDD